MLMDVARVEFSKSVKKNIEARLGADSTMLRRSVGMTVFGNAREMLH